MLYIRKLFTQDLRDGKQIAFPKEPSYSFFSFDYINKEKDRAITFTFRARFEQFQEFEGRVITTRLYSATSESRMDGEVKAFIRDELKAKVDDLLIMKNKGTRFTEFEFMFVPKENKYYSLLYNLCDGVNHSIYTFENNRKDSRPLQQIFYGAPGTGKSFEIKEQTKGEEVVRTTFHPDSDYSTFVGAYKPIMEDQDVRVVPVVVNNGINLNQNNGTYKEKRISYQFVKQAFLKAYLSAWKKFSMGVSSNIISQNSQVMVSFGNDTWWLEKVFDDKVSYTKESIVDLKTYENLVKRYWDNNTQYDDPEYFSLGNSERYQAAACLWYKENHSIEHTAEECWEAVMIKLESGGTIIYTPGKNQSYSIFLRDNKVIIASKASAKKDAIKKCFYNPVKNGNSVRDAIAQKLRDYSNYKDRFYVSNRVDVFDEDVFDELWNRLKEEVNQSQTTASGSTYLSSIRPQYLIIEEINRGNCAQIFGDLFQLLDRSDNGYSTYPIDADTDIKNAINKAFKEEEDYKLDFDLNIEGAIEDYTSNYGSSLSDDVQSGRVLLLPPNFYIWATMNTSDQSLFPIDSAFKRRWDWVYKPIGYKNAMWTIEIGEKKYKWVDFQKEINQRIFDIDNSEDKQLGDYFVNADQTNNIISADTLLNKILFYLWNDVCKDEPDQIFRWIDDKQEKSIKFSDFFCEDRDKRLQGFMSFLKIKAIGELEETKEPETIETLVENEDEVNS